MSNLDINGIKSVCLFFSLFVCIFFSFSFFINCIVPDVSPLVLPCLAVFLDYSFRPKLSMFLIFLFVPLMSVLRQKIKQILKK